MHRLLAIGVVVSACFVSTCLLSACAAAPAAPPRAEPTLAARRTWVYTDGKGLELTIVEIDAAPATHAQEQLVTVTGTFSRIEGAVLPHRRAVTTEGNVLVTTLNGEEFPTVLYDATNASDCLVRVPESKTRVRLTRDTAREATAADAVLRGYADQAARQAVARLQAFGHADIVARQEKWLQAFPALFARSCGHDIAIEVPWSSIDDAALRVQRVAYECSEAVNEMIALCAYASARAAFAEVRLLRCERDASATMSLRDGTLTYVMSGDGARSALRAFLLDKAAFSAKGSAEAGGASLSTALGAGTLRARINLESTELCADANGTMVGRERAIDGDTWLFYGRGESFTRVPVVFMGGEDYFFDPREMDRRAAAELQYHSGLRVEPASSSCVLLCGARRIPLRLLDAESTSKALQGRRDAPAPPRRRPYALARDNRGSYYYVDTGWEEGSRQFRVYIGLKGALAPQRMVDIVSDAQGEIFATASGSLRLVLDKKESYWIRNDKSERLLNVPLGESWGLIYNELGVYTGQLFGTPCDVL